VILYLHRLYSLLFSILRTHKLVDLLENLFLLFETVINLPRRNLTRYYSFITSNKSSEKILMIDILIRALEKISILNRYHRLFGIFERLQISRLRYLAGYFGAVRNMEEN
jgi:hypothetical protein